MTESEWSTCGEPDPMIELLRQKLMASVRKMRLFGCGYCELHRHLIRDGTCIDAIRRVERYADGFGGTDDLRMVRNIANNSLYKCKPAWIAARYARLAVYCAGDNTDALSSVQGNIRAARYVIAEKRGESYGENERDSRFVEAELLREIFGNPFRPVAVDTARLAPSVILQAQAIHDDRAYDRMPILGDALEESGCDDREILDHCRSKIEHVRGCWVVHAILGKS